MITLKFVDQFQGDLAPVGDELLDLVAQLNAVLSLDNDGQIALTPVGSTAGTGSGGGSVVASNVTQWNGVALPAGGYSVRVQSTQRGTVSLSGATSNTASISTVVSGRATDTFSGATTDSNANNESNIRISAGSSTVTGTKTTGTNAAVAGFTVTELV